MSGGLTRLRNVLPNAANTLAGSRRGRNTRPVVNPVAVANSRTPHQRSKGSGGRVRYVGLITTSNHGAQWHECSRQRRTDGRIKVYCESAQARDSEADQASQDRSAPNVNRNQSESHCDSYRHRDARNATHDGAGEQSRLSRLDFSEVSRHPRPDDRASNDRGPIDRRDEQKQPEPLQD